MAHYRGFLPDLHFYQQTVACQFACPVRTDGRAYVNAIARGEYERAYLIARETNPFASTCGWVCGAPCEAACRRGKIDAPIAIRALKRFVNDRYGVYLGESGQAQHPPAWPTYVGRTDAMHLGNTVFPASRSGLNAARRRGDKTGKRVAIVGAGPAGLSCAHDLALLGHEVTLFEAAPVAGGMLRLGVPEYRLPRQIIELEIQAILALGPTLKLNQTLGKDFSLADLRREFDAVFIAIGTYRSRKLNVEGEQLDGVLRAVDFLLNVNLGGYNLDLGKRILVIGGGNVAMDVARTAARLGHPTQSGGDIDVALDVARTAVRLGATQEVRCLVVEARHEMLADPVELLETEEEGITIHNHLSPIRILGADGRVTGMETLEVARAFDEQGRFNPQLIPNSEKVWACDSVIIAIGQSGDLDWVQPEDGLTVAPRGTLQIDKETLTTTAEGIFAGGDIAFGPRLIINAVADGQRAARSIHTYLQRVQPRKVRKGFFTPIAKNEYPDIGPLRDYLCPPRQHPPALAVDRRIGVSLVEIGYDEPTAHQQAKRCLICTINPIFDGQLCILCNGCVDVCPMDCLKLVPVSTLAGDEQVTAVIEHHLSAIAAPDNTTQPVASAMLLDPTRCIRCGLCATRCPTEAVKMETFHFTEEILFQPKSTASQA
jgi:NADPH-dependent glutamate synthase beta subunit-like oxidoreductase/formate hydrogenlyase subunit 6/NADH:ubiquinone oxidoreductase subunit I